MRSSSESSSSLRLSRPSRSLLATAALAEAKNLDAALVVCFIRQVHLSYKYDERRTIDTDLAALRTFSRFLEIGHELGVPVMPVYDTGPDAAELLAENAATYGCDRVLIGTSRQGALYHLIKGTFQRRLEAILPSEIHVQVIAPLPPDVPESSEEQKADDEPAPARTP